MSKLCVAVPSGEGLVEGLGAALAGVPDVEVVEWNLGDPPPRARIDIAVPAYWGGTAQLAGLSGAEIRLVQWQSIGYNGVAEHLPEGLPLANAAGVHEGSTAELALGLALAAQRGIPEFVRNGDRGHWQLQHYPSFADRRVLLVGYGGVSKAIEARLGGFEVEITRLARTARTDRNLAGDEVPVRALAELHEALGQAEIVFLAVPLTDDTRGLIDAAALAAMPDGALLVNVARGPVVETDALVAELSSGRLRAALDVTEPEPLPADHPLWSCPGVLISPHVGGDSSAMMPRITALIRRQLEHLQRGETPENLVIGEWAEG